MKFVTCCLSYKSLLPLSQGCWIFGIGIRLAVSLFLVLCCLFSYSGLLYFHFIMEMRLSRVKNDLLNCRLYSVKEAARILRILHKFGEIELVGSLSFN